MPYFSLLVLFVFLAGISAAVSVWLTSLPEISRKVVPFSGVVLVLISLLWVLPELVTTFGRLMGPMMLLASIGLVWFVDRNLYPVCPSCAHSHDHDACSTRLHGFAPPLLAASIIHSLFDGWMFAYGQDASRTALSLGVMLHKIPECIALGVILRAALSNRTLAIFWSFASQLPMLLGALLQPVASAFLSSAALGALLALGGGTFVYLGFHAVHAEWKRRVAHRVVRI